MISTDGFGAAGSIRLARSMATSSSSRDRLDARAAGAIGVKPHRRQAFRLDRRHVGAGGLDPQHLDLLAEEVAARVFSEVLPPPCSTSCGSRPSSRVV